MTTLRRLWSTEEEERKPKKYTSVIFALAAVVGVNLVITGFLWTTYERTSHDLDATNEMLRDLQGRVQATARYVAIGNLTLTFMPYNPVQTVPPNTITYLVGFVQISNLTNVVARPLTLIVQFVPNVTYPEYGTVTYEYTDVQTLEIPPKLDVVMMPWGCFPLTLTDFKSGDEILWTMDVIAIAQWSGIEVTRVSLTVTFKLIVA